MLFFLILLFLLFFDFCLINFLGEFGLDFLLFLGEFILFMFDEMFLFELLWIDLLIFFFMFEEIENK